MKLGQFMVFLIQLILDLANFMDIDIRELDPLQFLLNSVEKLFNHFDRLDFGFVQFVSVVSVSVSMGAF